MQNTLSSAATQRQKISLVSALFHSFLAKRTAGTCMIFTVANVEAISEVVFNMSAQEMLIVYSNSHPGNQRRVLQVRFGASAFKELIQTIHSMPFNEPSFINAGSA